MSLRARIQIHGSQCDVYASVRTEHPDGTVSVTWSRKLFMNRILLQENATQVDQHEQGQRRVAFVTGFALPGVDIEEADGIAVVGGLHAGKRFKVLGAPVHRGAGGSTGHTELNLESTVEVIG